MNAPLENVGETTTRMPGRWRLSGSKTMLDFGGGLSANLLHAVAGEAYGRPSEAHILSLAMGCDRNHRQWRNDRVIIEGHLPARTTNVVPSGATPRAFLSEPMKVLHLYIPSTRLRDIAVEAELTPSAATPEIIDLPLLDDPALVALSEQAAAAVAASSSIDLLWRDSLALAICARLLQRWSNLGERSANAEPKAARCDWRVRRAIEFLDARVAEDVSLTELAAAVDLSPSHLLRLFRDAVGVPPHRWLMQRRVERAREMLADPHVSVTEIAHACGFASSQHFSTAFRRHMGATPSDYRRERLP